MKGPKILCSPRSSVFVPTHDISVGTVLVVDDCPHNCPSRLWIRSPPIFIYFLPSIANPALSIFRSRLYIEVLLMVYTI